MSGLKAASTKERGDIPNSRIIDFEYDDMNNGGKEAAEDGIETGLDLADTSSSSELGTELQKPIDTPMKYTQGSSKKEASSDRVSEEGYASEYLPKKSRKLNQFVCPVSRKKMCPETVFNKTYSERP